MWGAVAAAGVAAAAGAAGVREAVFYRPSAEDARLAPRFSALRITPAEHGAGGEGLDDFAVLVAGLRA
jgi:hypothetical protein